MGIKNKKVLIGLSGGINSMAVLCAILEDLSAKALEYDLEYDLGSVLKSATEPEYPPKLTLKVPPEIPKELHLYYAHFEEHSPDTRLFVEAGFELARKTIESINTKRALYPSKIPPTFIKLFCIVTENSVIEYFREEDIIPHPMMSPCSLNLKVIPMKKYCIKNGIEIDLVGYLKSEVRRMKRSIAGVKKENKRRKALLKKKYIPVVDKLFPLSDLDDEYCFEIVRKYIGWYPKIYDLKSVSKSGNVKRLFSHNNCLPCKNMSPAQYQRVKEHYPEYFNKAVELEDELGKYFGMYPEGIKYVPVKNTKKGRDENNESDWVTPNCVCDFD